MPCQLSWHVLRREAITIMTLIFQCYFCPYETEDEDQYIRHGAKYHLYLPMFPNEAYLQGPPHAVDQLRRESSFVRPLVARTELDDNLRAIIEKIALLYGLPTTTNFPPDDKVQNWFGFYNMALRLIKRTKELVQEILRAE
jgi:hypothetical protein